MNESVLKSIFTIMPDDTSVTKEKVMIIKMKSAIME